MYDEDVHVGPRVPKGADADGAARHEYAASNLTSVRAQGAATSNGATYNVSLGYLRAFAVLLVLAHHAVLAYHPFAPNDITSLIDQPRWWQAFPVMDAQRSPMVSLFAGWNDIFLMALFFFLSGLFVVTSVERKGAKSFVRRRMIRLGIPFMVLAGIIAPLAYYPTYLATPPANGISGFVQVWLSLGNWPAGPAWFLWVLLLFSAGAAALFAYRSDWAVDSARRLLLVTDRPVLSFTLLAVVSGLAYLPMAYLVDPLHWTAIGPFFFQTSRLPLYAVYFFGGIVIGAQGFSSGLLAPTGRLAQRWPLWLGAASIAYGLTVAIVIAAFAGRATTGVLTAAHLGFVVCSATSCFALLAIFLRFATTRRRVFDSLTANAYGMYIVHYAFASWVPYALLDISLPVLAKATIAIVATVLLSWITSAVLRRVPAFGRVI